MKKMIHWNVKIQTINCKPMHSEKKVVLGRFLMYFSFKFKNLEIGFIVFSF